MSLLTSITKKAPTIFNNAKQDVVGIGKSVGRAGQGFGELGQALQNTLNKGYTSLTGKAPTILAGDKNGPFQKGSQLNTSINSSLKANTPIEKSAGYATDAFTMFGPKLISKAPSVIGGLVKNAPEIIGSLSKNAPKLGADAYTGFKSGATNFAEKLANVDNNFAGKTGDKLDIPFRNPEPIKSGTVDQRVFSDIRPNTTVKPSITEKTNVSRTSTLDTRTSPTKVGTTKTNIPVTAVEDAPKAFPWLKTGLAGGTVGLGLATLGDSGTTANAEPLSSNVPTPTDNMGATQTDASGSLAPNDVFGGDFVNNPGGVFESSTPAPQTGTQMGGSFQPEAFSTSFGSSTGAGSIGTGVGGSGGGQYKSKTDEYITDEDKKKRYEELHPNKTRRQNEARAQQEALRKLNESFGGKENRLAYENLNNQVTDYNKRIADLLNNQAGYGIDLETSAASSSARNGLADMFDTQTRKSLIPLQTSLALVQAERDRIDKLKQQNFENQQSIKTQNGFTLGNDQQRFEIDPTTGEYKMVGQGFRSTDKPTSQPTSIQEYEYAKNQGYTGTFNEFQQQSSTKNEPMYFNLGDTRYQQDPVTGQVTQVMSSEKLSGDAAKINAITQTMIPEINSLKTRFQQDYKGALRGYLTGTDRELVKLIDQVADKVGRLRSGGAVNRDEEERFKRQIASFMDLPFGNSQDAIDALDGLINEAQQVNNRMQPNGQQSYQNTGNSWDW